MDQLDYLYSEEGLENGPLGFPAVNPMKSRHSDKRKLIYVGKRYFDDDQTRENVERVMKETARKTRVRTDGSWISRLLEPYVEKAIYYLNKVFAKETGYIVDYGTVELAEIKEKPFVYDKKGRVRGVINGMYNTIFKKNSFNPELAEMHISRPVKTLVHELGHNGKDYQGELGEYGDAFGPLTVPLVEAKNRLITDMVTPQVLQDPMPGKYIRAPEYRFSQN